MVSVPASEIQKNFGEWHDKAYEAPVEITRYGRRTAYLVSAKLFQELWSSYRKAVPIEALDETEMSLIAKAQVQTDKPYTLDEIPDVDDAQIPTP